MRRAIGYRDAAALFRALGWSLFLVMGTFDGDRTSAADRRVRQLDFIHGAPWSATCGERGS